MPQRTNKTERPTTSAVLIEQDTDAGYAAISEPIAKRTGMCREKPITSLLFKWATCWIIACTKSCTVSFVRACSAKPILNDLTAAWDHARVRSTWMRGVPGGRDASRTRVSGVVFGMVVSANCSLGKMGTNSANKTTTWEKKVEYNRARSCSNKRLVREPERATTNPH